MPKSRQTSHRTGLAEQLTTPEHVQTPAEETPQILAEIAAAPDPLPQSTGGAAQLNNPPDVLLHTLIAIQERLAQLEQHLPQIGSAVNQLAQEKASEPSQPDPAGSSSSSSSSASPQRSLSPVLQPDPNAGRFQEWQQNMVQRLNGPKAVDTARVQETEEKARQPRGVKIDVPTHLTFNLSSKNNMLPENFLLSMQDQLALAGCTTDEQRLAAVTKFLTGTSNEWWWNNRMSQNLNTFEKFKAAFMKHAADPGELDRRRMAYEAIKHLPGQPVRAYADKLRAAAALLPSPDRPTDQQLAYRFRSRLQDPVRRLVNAYYSGQEFEPSFQQCVDYAVKLMAQPGESNEQRTVRREVNYVENAQHKRKSDEMLKAAVAKVKAKGITTIDELRNGKRLTKLSPDQRQMLLKFGLCTYCRTEVHPNTRENPCPRSAEIKQLLQNLPRDAERSTAPKNE